MTFQIKKHLIINEMKQLPEFQYTFPMYSKQDIETVVSISNFILIVRKIIHCSDPRNRQLT